MCVLTSYGPCRFSLRVDHPHFLHVGFIAHLLEFSEFDLLDIKEVFFERGLGCFKFEKFFGFLLFLFKSFGFFFCKLFWFDCRFCRRNESWFHLLG